MKRHYPFGIDPRELQYYENEIEYQLHIKDVEDEAAEMRRKVCRLENHVIGADKEIARLRKRLGAEKEQAS